MARRPVWLAGLGLICTAGMQTEASAAHFQVIGKVDTFRYDTTGPLTADAAGNLYGEVADSNLNGGQVFELTVSSGYAETVLYTFSYNHHQNGASVLGGVTLDQGQIIGTAGSGGLNESGTVFSLGVPGQITLTTLHKFNYKNAAPNDANEPDDGVVAGPGGLFYGATASGGGTMGPGSVYSISVSVTAPVYTRLHRFGGAGDGSEPSFGHLVWDGGKRLYGTAYNGGANGLGAVFMMELTKKGWQEKVIYSFAASNDVTHPFYGVAMDSAGALYGCGAAGANGEGGVFQLTPPAQGEDAWQETVLYNFGATPHDGNASYDDPGCGVTIDPVKKLIIGTTSGGGTYGSGTIWQLKPPAGGQSAWQETVDHSFYTKHPDSGSFPAPPPIKIGKVYYGVADARGHIYAFTP